MVAESHAVVIVHPRDQAKVYLAFGVLDLYEREALELWQTAGNSGRVIVDKTAVKPYQRSAECHDEQKTRCSRNRRSPRRETYHGPTSMHPTVLVCRKTKNLSPLALETIKSVSAVSCGARPTKPSWETKTRRPTHALLTEPVKRTAFIALEMGHSSTSDAVADA